MLLLAGHLEMSAADEVAVNQFFADNLFDAVDGSQRRGIHALGPFASVHGDEFVNAELHSSEDHPAIPGTGAPSDGFAFQYGNSRAAFCQYAGCREAGEARPDHSHINHFGQGSRSIGSGHLGGCKPIISFEHAWEVRGTAIISARTIGTRRSGRIRPLGAGGESVTEARQEGHAPFNAAGRMRPGLRDSLEYSRLVDQATFGKA